MPSANTAVWEVRRRLSAGLDWPAVRDDDSHPMAAVDGAWDAQDGRPPTGGLQASAQMRCTPYRAAPRTDGGTLWHLRRFLLRAASAHRHGSISRFTLASEARTAFRSTPMRRLIARRNRPSR